jgi:hypothetical protein
MVAIKNPILKPELIGALFWPFLIPFRLSKVSSFPRIKASPVSKLKLGTTVEVIDQLLFSPFLVIAGGIYQ